MKLSNKVISALYSCSNAHLRQVNSAFSHFARLRLNRVQSVLDHFAEVEQPKAHKVRLSLKIPLIIQLHNKCGCLNRSRWTATYDSKYYKPSSVLRRSRASIIYLRLWSPTASSNLPPDIGRATLNCRYTRSCNP